MPDNTPILINTIDEKIKKLLIIRDSEYVIKYPELRGSICTVIEKGYFLQSTMLYDRKFSEDKSNYFFSAVAAVNRHFRDWALDDVADIYNELREIALNYMEEEKG